MHFISYRHKTSSPINYSFGGEEKGQATSMQLVYALGSDDNSGFFYMPSDQIDEDHNPDPNYQIANGYTISSALAQYATKTELNNYALASSLNLYRTISDSYSKTETDNTFIKKTDGYIQKSNSTYSTYGGLKIHEDITTETVEGSDSSDVVGTVPVFVTTGNIGALMNPDLGDIKRYKGSTQVYVGPECVFDTLTFEVSNGLEAAIAGVDYNSTTGYITCTVSSTLKNTTFTGVLTYSGTRPTTTTTKTTISYTPVFYYNDNGTSENTLELATKNYVDSIVAGGDIDMSDYVAKTDIGYHTDSNQNIEFSIGSNTASPNKSLIYRLNADGEGSFYYEPNEEVSQTLNEDAEIATIGDVNAVKGQLEEYIKVFTIDYPGGLDLFYQNNYTLTGSLPNNMTAANLIEQGYNIICFVDGDLRIQFTMSQMSDEGMMMGYAPVPNLVRALSPQYISADIVVADSGYTIMLSKGQSIQLDLTLGNGYVTNVETLNVVRNLYRTYGLVSLRINNAVTFVPTVCFDYGTQGLLGFITDFDIVQYQ
jgi:hypothetical protein